MASRSSRRRRPPGSPGYPARARITVCGGRCFEASSGRMRIGPAPHSSGQSSRECTLPGGRDSSGRCSATSMVATRPILPRLREILTQGGVRFHLWSSSGPGAMGLGDGARVTLADGSSLEFDAVILTVPCPQVTALCPELSPGERARLDSVVYQGIVCPSLLLRRPLRSYYVTSITDEWVPFTAVIEMTALVDRERFGGHTLVYLPRYLTQTSPRVEAVRSRTS